MDKKAKLAELRVAYQNGQDKVREMTSNLLRLEGAMALLADQIAEEDKAAAASPETPNDP